MPVAGVSYGQLTATAPTAQQPCQQSSASLCSSSALGHRYVLSYCFLNLLKLFPADVAFVTIRNQGQPTLSRLSTVTPTRLATLVDENLFGFAIGVRSAINGTCHYSVQSTIGRPSPK